MATHLTYCNTRVQGNFGERERENTQLYRFEIKLNKLNKEARNI